MPCLWIFKYSARAAYLLIYPCYRSVLSKIYDRTTLIEIAVCCDPIFALFAVFKRAGKRVLVVIGGDDNYKDAAEEERAFLSRWAKRQISSQFKEEFMDGQKSFIFSWYKKHNPIHEEALLHFLDPAKMGTKFVHEPKRQPTTPSVDTSQVCFYFVMVVKHATEKKVFFSSTLLIRHRTTPTWLSTK